MLSSWKLREKWQKLWTLTKTADLDGNPWFLMKICSFWWKPQVFWWKSMQILMKTTDFDRNLQFFLWKLQILVWKPCSFQADLSSETTKTTFPTQPSTGQHQTLKSMDFSSEMKDHLPKKVTSIFFILCTQLTLFKTIWPDICIVHSIDSF